MRSCSRCRSSAPCGASGPDEPEQLAQLHVALQRPDPKIRTHLVAVAAPDALAGDVAGGDQPRDDAVRRTLGDAYPLGYVTQANTGVAGDAHQCKAVVRDELPFGPAGHCRRT